MGYQLTEKTIDDFQVGDRGYFAKTITEADVYLFAGITGDVAPHHVNAEYARTTRFGERIAHGMLTASLVSAALSRLVSPGAISESHEFRFTAPVRFGDTITATVEVIEKDVQRKRLKLRTVCTNQRGEVVLDGTAVQVMAIRKRANG